MVYFKIIMSANGPMPIHRKLCRALHLLAAHCVGEIVPTRLLHVAVFIAFLAPVLHRAAHHPVRRCLRRGMTKGIRNGKLPPRCFLRRRLVRRMFHQSNGTGGRCPPFYGFT